MKKKDLDKKIKEKCRELDLIELEKKKKRNKDIKWIVLSVLLVVFIILVLCFNNSDPSRERVDKVKEQKIVDRKIENNLDNSNVTLASEFVANNFGGNLIFLVSLSSFLFAVYFFIIKPFINYEDY